LRAQQICFLSNWKGDGESRKEKQVKGKYMTRKYYKQQAESDNPGEQMKENLL